MGLYDVLDQIIDLLQQRKRLTYRLLKREFALDDETLEDLKEELIYGQKLAVDEDGRVLIWTGESDGAPLSTFQSVQTSESPPSQQDQPPRAGVSSPEPPTPEAERRQLTVMFCDLADSTRLSGQLDPEDLRDVIRAYQSTSAEVIERYGGYIAQHLGDGLMVYFGWPQAHEDDTQRAVHVGLGIVEAMGQLNARLEREKDIRLAVRVGIHTGMVVVGEIGKGASQEHLALGKTPNIASRIEGIAEPNTVLISAATYQLVQGYFVCEDLGQYMLRGVDDAQQVHRVVRESDVQSRFDVAATRGLTPLVGRESEVTLLLERWEQAKDGMGQVVLISGEAGIGKSRLLQVMRDHVADEPHTRMEGRSSPYYQNTALYPVVEMLQRALRWQQDDTPDQRLAKLEQELSQYRLPLGDSVPLFAPLLSLPIPEDRYPPLNLSSQRQRQKTLESIVAILIEQAERQPVLFILEDLHWLDPTSLELLDLLHEQTPTTSVLTLLTCRPNFQPTWSGRSYLTQMTLNRLSRSQILQMAERVASEKRLPPEVMQQIVEKTDGVPLFVEEMTKAVLESGTLKEWGGQLELAGSLSTLTIPATLQDSLMARLDRLVTAKAVAQYAAVIGRQFSYNLLHAVSQLNERTLQDELHRLVEAELVYQRGLPPQATYVFKHALIQDTAYQSLLKRTRQQYHQCIAQELEGHFPETSERQPELLAHHYTEAGLIEEAVDYWRQAGERAIERSGYVEATGHLTRGLSLLKTLPETPMRTQQELNIQTLLGQAWMATKGQAASEVVHTYARARALCQQLGEAPQLFPVLWGLWRYYLQRAELQTAHELGKQLLTLARRAQDSVLLLEAHLSLGATLLWRGDATSYAHLEQAMALSLASQHGPLTFLYGQDPRVTCLLYVAWSQWVGGYPHQAAQSIHQALTLAQTLSHTHTLAFALTFAALIHQLRREEAVVRKQAEALTMLSTEQEFPFFEALGTIIYGWGLAAQGDEQEGIDQINRGLAAYHATGAEHARPHFLALLAEVHGRMGQIEEGLHILAEALALVVHNGEQYYAAELHRLKGELLLQQVDPDTAQVEACFQQAFAIARRQQAKSWELRAATSLASLWQSQGKRQAAYELLAPVYGWFTEGFDTADLKDAKALLDALGRNVASP